MNWLRYTLSYGLLRSAILCVRGARSTCGNTIRVSPDDLKLFNDPIHGSIELNALEQAIINTPEFYRLKNIKQLGGTVHVYPGATHTRFEHSIGVCYIAGEIIQHLRKKIANINEKRGLEEKEIEILPEDEYCVRVAALCHDLGHGPYSHSFEPVARKILKSPDFTHEEMSKRIFEKIFNDNEKIFEDFGLKRDEHLKMIQNMIEGFDGSTIQKTKHFLYEIVANKCSEVDVDKWDYFARDCHYLGITNDFDWRRCMTLTSIVKSGSKEDSEKIEEYHIGFAIKERNNLMGMFRTRCVLNQKAYQHEVVNGIEMMIADILELMKDEPMIRTRKDEPTKKDEPITRTENNVYKSLCDILKDAFIKPAADADLSGYLALTDSILDLISNYERRDESPDAATATTRDTNIEKARELLQRIKVRDLYKCKSTRYYPKIPSIDEGKKGMLSYLEKRKSDIDIEEELTEKFRTFHEGNDFQIKFVTFSFASEKMEDPIEKVYFFDKKPMSAGETKFHRGDHISKFDQHQVSKLNKPEALVEYRLMLYSKKKSKEDEDDTKLKENFKAWIKKEEEKKNLELESGS